MSDTDTSTDKPLENLAAAEHAIDPPAPADLVVETESADPMTAADRLSAFEDEHFGKRMHVDDKIERGSGSHYQMAAPEIRKQHAALEKLVLAEQTLADASAKQLQAQADYAAAEKACDAAPE